MSPPGAGMAETQGTSAMSLYNSNQSAGMGGEMAQKLSDFEMMQRQKMVPPTGGADMARPSGAPEWYNYSGMPAAKYSVPSEMKERMVARAAIRNAAAEQPRLNQRGAPRREPTRELAVLKVGERAVQQLLFVRVRRVLLRRIVAVAAIPARFALRWYATSS